MAGMLPGVESARIRRIHQSNLNLNNGGGASTKRPSFCLHAINHQEFRTTSPSSMERNPMEYAGCDDDMLDAAASEAKKRLDLRLQNHWKSQIKRKVKGKEKISLCGGEAKVTVAIT